MKKHSLLMMLPFALIITGCSGLSKGSIFNKKFMKKNFGNYLDIQHEYKAPEKVELNFEDGITAAHTYNQYDLFEVEKDGVKGYYNVLTNSYPVPLSAGITSDIEFGTASVTNYTYNPGITFRYFYGVKTVDGKEIIQVFDDWGNKLYEGENGTVGVSIYRLNRYEVQENERMRIRISINNVFKAFVYYNVDGTLKEILNRDEYYEKYPYEQSDYGQSLAKYGHKDLCVIANEYEDEYRYTVFNTKKGKYVSSFVVPEGVAEQIIIGDKYIYQVREQLTTRATKYDYSVGENKFSLKTYSVNIPTGKTKEIKTDFVLPTTTQWKDLYNVDGVVKYEFLGQVSKIGKDKVLSPVQRDVIVNENLKEVADVTGVQFRDLAPFDGDYYINPKGIIFDAKLKEVGYLRGDLTAGLGRIARVSALYGIINHKGEYLENPKYKSAVEFPDGVYQLEETNSWKYVRVTEKETIEVIKELSKDDYEKSATFIGKFQGFTRKSDSKPIFIDVTTGGEVEIPEAPEGASQLYATKQTRLNSTMNMIITVYLKDGHYTAVLITDKYSQSYATKK